MAGHGKPERAGLEARVRAVGDDDVRLRLAIAVVDGHAPGLLEGRGHLRVEPLAARDETADLGRPEAAELPQLGERGVLRRRLAHDGDAEAIDQVETLERVEDCVVEDELGTARPGPDERMPHRLGRAGLRRAPHRVSAPCVEPVLGRHASGEDGAVRMADELRGSRRSRRLDHECDVAGRGIMGRRLLRGILEERSPVVDVEHHRAVQRPRDLGLGAALGDHEVCTGSLEPDVEAFGRQRGRARNHDRADLEAGEHDLDPVDVRSREHDYGVARPHPALAEKPRPASCAFGHDVEGARLDDAVLPDERDRAPLRVVRQSLDHVAREVEPIGNLPATFGERRLERQLERRDGQTVAFPPAAADAKLLHGTQSIDG